MKLSASDAVVSVVTLVLSSVLVFFYVQETGRSTFRTDDEPLGTIVFKKLNATRRISGGLVWERIRNNSPVFEDDTLRTAEASEAVIRFDDGTSLEMYENSMLRLSFKGDERTLEFLGGEISVSGSAGARGTASTGYTIKAGDKTVAVQEGTRASLVRREETLSVEVLDGGITLVHGDGRSETVDRAKELEVNLSSGAARVVSRPVYPTAPEQNARFLIEHPGPAKLKFAWNYEGGADSPCVLEISGNSSFESLAFSAPSSEGTLTAEVVPGTWFWRVRSPDGTVSAARRISLYADTPPRPILPAQNAEILYRNTLPSLQFSWTGSQYASACIFEIAPSPDFANPVKIERTTVDRISVGSLGEGLWYWRVTPVYPMALPEGQSEPEIRSFMIRRRGEMASLDAVMPLPGSMFLIEVTAAKGMYFSWTPDPEAVEYEFAVSRSPDMRNAVAGKTSVRPWISLTGPEAESFCMPGIWYWAVRWKDAEGNVSPYSEPRPLHGTDTSAAVKLVFPPDGYTIADSLVSSTRFTWKSYQSAATFFQLSRDRSFSTVEWEERTDIETLIGREWEPGTWYWRVRTLNVDGTVFAETPARMFRVVEPLPEPRLVSPPSGKTLHLRKEDSFVFSWTDVEGADYYRFTLYSVSNDGSETLVVGKEFIQETRIELPSGEFADGPYRVRLQAFGLDKESSTRIIGYLAQSSFDFKIVSRMTLQFPHDGAVFDGLEARRHGVEFSWNLPDPPENSEVVVSGDPDGKTVLFRKPGGSGTLRIERLDPGRYYWTVRGNLSGLDLSARESNRFTVLGIPPLPASNGLTPYRGFVFGPAELRSVPGLRFSWEPVPTATRYIFSLFRETDPLPLVRADDLQQPTFTLSDLSILDRGAYRWTVQAQGIDRNGELERDGTVAESSFRIDLPRIRAPQPREREYFYGR